MIFRDRPSSQAKDSGPGGFRGTEGDARRSPATPLPLALALLAALLLPAPVMSGEPMDVTLYVTDFGIQGRLTELGNREAESLKTGDDFTARSGVFPDIPRSGQVLVVMPSDREMQKTSDRDLTRGIFEKIKARVDGGLAVGATRFELQLVEHVNILGYADDKRQEMANRFGKCAYEAIGLLHAYLRDKGIRPQAAAVLGSNGTKVFTENIPAWKAYMREASLYNGRASMESTLLAIKQLGPQNVRIYNTRGDYWAPNVGQLRSIGNHDVARELKQRFPELTVGWIEPLGSGGPAHLAGMDASRSLRVQYLNRDAKTYGPAVQVMGRDLFSPGGVWINPAPEKAGAGGAETREKVLDSRPSGGGGLSWPVKIQEGAK